VSLARRAVAAAEDAVVMVVEGATAAGAATAGKGAATKPSISASGWSKIRR